MVLKLGFVFFIEKVNFLFLSLDFGVNYKRFSSTCFTVSVCVLYKTGHINNTNTHLHTNPLLHSRTHTHSCTHTLSVISTLRHQKVNSSFFPFRTPDIKSISEHKLSFPEHKPPSPHTTRTSTQTQI